MDVIVSNRCSASAVFVFFLPLDWDSAYKLGRKKKMAAASRFDTTYLIIVVLTGRFL